MASIKDDEQQRPLRILFFPFLVPGHLIPMADLATLFAGRGVRCTILTTPVQASTIRSIVYRANGEDSSSPAIEISVVPFPDVGLPPEAESGIGLVTRGDQEKFHQATQLLREPFEKYLADHHADVDAVVSDGFFYWSVDVAAEYGVPRLGFLGINMFARCCADSILRVHNPDDDGNSDDHDPDSLVAVPGLPHRVELRRSQMMKRPAHIALFRTIYAADQRSYGELFNSFHELEPDYVEHYRTTLRRRPWLVGPVAISSGSKDVASRGTDTLSPDAHGCLPWLDAAKPAGSVVYIAFGTMSSFSREQMREIARGLELSCKNFVWVIADGGKAEASSSDEWMPEGFAASSRGYIIRGWAPQVFVLSHPAVGCFVTHCGWNSTLEAVSAGVPMVTWPRHADQFLNERLIVDVLKVGVSVGAKDYASAAETHQVIDGELIAESIRRLMEVHGDAMRSKARELRVKARSAVEKGGSTYTDVGLLVDELMATRRVRR